MSFNIKLEKNDEGTYDIKTGPPEYNPDVIVISGHVETDGQVVDLTARVDGLVASTSRRDIKAY